MGFDTYNYEKHSEFSAMAPVRRAIDVTPSATEFSTPSRAIMVSEAATVTGILSGMDTSHTTHELQAGTMYPFSFKSITAVSAGTVKAYF